MSDNAELDRSTTKAALQALSPYQRMDRYRQYAASAFGRAEIVESGAVKATLLDIAARWDGLAQDIQRRLDLPPE